MSRTGTVLGRGGLIAACLILLVASQLLAGSGTGGDGRGRTGGSTPPAAESRLPYSGTNYYAPVTARCPYYTTWTTGCYPAARTTLEADMRFLSGSGASGLQRVWVSLDQLFSCFDRVTGFCGYDDAAVGNLLDTLHLMARYGQHADLVLFAQPNRPADVHYFHVEALDGRHEQMRASYVEAARQFVRRLVADPSAARAVKVIDIENEGFFQNRTRLIDLGTACGQNGGCIDQRLSRPFFAEVYAALKGIAPQFLYTVSALRGELLDSDIDYWVRMYPVDVYDVHLYVSHPEDHVSLFARAAHLPKPWFAGEVGTANYSDSGAPCYTYDGDDPCTVATDAWWHAHLGPDYGAQAVLVENAGTVFQYRKATPGPTRLGSALTATR